MNACRLATLPLATWAADRRKSWAIRLVFGGNRMTTNPRRRGRLTRIEEAVIAWAEIEARRRGGRGQLHEALLPAGASPTTQAVLDFIRTFKKQEHLSPTIREIQIGCDLSSTSVAHYHLRLLEKSFGALTRKPGNSRSIVLAEEAL